MHSPDAPRQTRNNIFFVLGALMVAYGFFYTYQVWRQETAFKLQEVEQMQRQVAHVQSQNDNLKNHIGVLQTPMGVEKVAREQLGLVRPHEMTYLVVNGSKHPAVEVAPQIDAGPPPMSPLHRCTHWFHVLWNGGD